MVQLFVGAQSMSGCVVRCFNNLRGDLEAVQSITEIQGNGSIFCQFILLQVYGMQRVEGVR
jgi:hypothetical protein